MRQIAVRPAQQLDQLMAFGVGQAGKGFGAHLVRQVEDASQDRARLVGQHQPAGAAVARIGPPLDPAILLHPVELPDQGHRLDFQKIGEARLVDALVAGEIAEHPALRAGQAEKEQGTLIEAPREKPRHVVHEKAKAAVEVHPAAIVTNNHP